MKTAGVALAGAVALGACGSSGPSPDGQLGGHFLTSATPVGDLQLAIAFTSVNGVVTGYGWAGIPGLGAPGLEPLAVSGQATSKTVSLTLVFADQITTGGLYGIFSGQSDGSELRGTLSRSAQSLSTVLARVDTTASGRFELETTGGNSGVFQGRAGFGTSAPGFHLDLGFRTQPAPIVTIVGAGRPPRGSQPVDAAGGAGGLTGTISPPGGPAYQIVGGVLQIDLSSPEALIGTVRGTGRAGGTADIQFTARFSAGCPSPCR